MLHLQIKPLENVHVSSRSRYLLYKNSIQLLEFPHSSPAQMCWILLMSVFVEKSIY